MALRKEEKAGRGRLAGDTARLLQQLADGNAVRRDAAVARLRVIGAPAFPAVARVIESDAAPVVRVAALAVLDGLDDARAVALGCRTLASPDVTVAIAAIALLRGWLTHERGIEAVEALTIAALDRSRPNEVRLAALDALSDLPPHLVAPVRATSALEPGDAPLDEPAAALEWLATHHSHASLSALHDLLSSARDAEPRAPAPRRDDWLRVRGAAHLALARRGSRLALYDLRDSLGGAPRPLPLDFLAAVVAIGDESCLEPLGRAWAHAGAEPWWQVRLVETGRDLVTRLGLTSRHKIMRRLKTKWPGFHATLAQPPGLLEVPR